MKEVQDVTIKEQVRPAVIAWVAEHKHINESEVTDGTVINAPEDEYTISVSVLGIGTKFRVGENATVAKVIATFEELCDLGALGAAGIY